MAGEYFVEVSEHPVDFFQEILVILECWDFSSNCAGVVFVVVLELSSGIFLVETPFWKVLIESV